jgi:hypothetical protein
MPGESGYCTADLFDTADLFEEAEKIIAKNEIPE